MLHLYQHQTWNMLHSLNQYLWKKLGGKRNCVFKPYVLRLKMCKLDGVGPVDNRPSPAKLDHFVRKKRRKKYCDM